MNLSRQGLLSMCSFTDRDCPSSFGEDIRVSEGLPYPLGVGDSYSSVHPKGSFVRDSTSSWVTPNNLPKTLVSTPSFLFVLSRLPEDRLCVRVTTESTGVPVPGPGNIRVQLVSDLRRPDPVPHWTLLRRSLLRPSVLGSSRRVYRQTPYSR